MAMDLNEIENLIKEALTDATVGIQDLAGDGNHYSATVTSSKFLGKNAVHFDELGTINEDQLFINEKTKVTIDELRTSNTNWLTNYMSK